VLTAFLLALLGASRTDAVADPCDALQPTASVTARVVASSRSARDSVVRATVCVVPARASTVKLGSYHGELYFNPAVYSVSAVEKGDGGVRVENATIAGQVNFAGAAPSGFAGRTLVTVVLRAKGAQRPALKLAMKELNTTDGKSLMQGLVIPEGTQ
jgi:hypothetical protein